jgi:RIP metalloprotease RseP
MLGGIAAAAAIIFFVTAHEAGHFFAAKAVGMKATQFFFGFGPKIWSTQRGETEYGFKWLPLGGYVRIVGMNPLEEVAPQDMGRTYREKKFWEKSLVVLAGVGTNFLLAFLIFYGVVLASGIPGEPIPEVGRVVPDSPADAAGLQEGDTILAVDGDPVTDWPDMTESLEAAGAGPTEITVDRDGETFVTVADLEPVPYVDSVAEGSGAEEMGIAPGDRIYAYNGLDVNTIDAWNEAAESAEGEPATIVVQREDADGEPELFEADVAVDEIEVVSGGGFLGMAPAAGMVSVGPIEGVGYAGRLVGGGITSTFDAIFQMVRRSSLAQYVGVFLGDTDVPDEIRPVSPIGIVSIGTQAEDAAFFLFILAHVNVILATINLLPLFPLDGGHFAVALYEKVTGRQADIRRLMPIAAAVIGLFAFLGFVAIILDVANPINL